MTRVRVTERDPQLPHQIKLSLSKGLMSRTTVSCNCSPQPLGETDNNGDVWAIYNRPELHNNAQEEFVPREHHIRNAKVYEVE